MLALMCIYAIELLEDNIAESRANLLEILAEYLHLDSADEVIRAASFTGVVSFAGLAWYFQSKADQHFDNYLHSGNPNTMNSEWNRTEELDKISGWMVVLSQVCSQILILTYIEHE